MNTKEQKRDFLQYLESYKGNVTEACKAFNIARGTYYLWINSDPDFAAECEITKKLCRESKIDNAEDQLEKLINEKNIVAIIFFLKTQAKHRGYTEKQEIEHSGGVNISINNHYNPDEQS